MAIFTSEQVFQSFSSFISDPVWSEKARKKNADFEIAVNKVRPEDITLGPGPVFVRGQVEGNSTAAGEKTYGDTTTKRTVSMDFTTPEYWFISDNNKAELSVCKAATKYYTGYSDVVHTKHEAKTIAYDYGKTVCGRSLYDLDFNMKEYRLNRYKLIETGEDTHFDFYPAYAMVRYKSGKESKVHIGYCYRLEGEDHIDLNVGVPMTAKGKLLLWGGIAAAAIALIVILSLL